MTKDHLPSMSLETTAVEQQDHAGTIRKKTSKESLTTLVSLETSDTVEKADHAGTTGKKRSAWWLSLLTPPGPATQIVIAAALAIGTGLAVSFTVDEVPKAAVALIKLPGDCWLRALKCVVLPLIVTSMILAVQQLKEMSRSVPKMARWTIGYYLATTLLAVLSSTFAVVFGWKRLLHPIGPGPAASLADGYVRQDQHKTAAPQDVALSLVKQLVPTNIVDALATDALLSVLVLCVVIGYMLRAGSPLLTVVREVEQIVTVIVGLLVRLAPVGVFFLTLVTMLRLDIVAIGINLGVLVAGALAGMAVHSFLLLPLIFLVTTRRNPYAFFARTSSAWRKAWRTGSSAAAVPVTIKSTIGQGVPSVVTKFVVSVGCTLNMDGTAIYFPIVVTFMAATQGIVLNVGEYIIIVLLSTLATIGSSPIPSSSLVLTIMICESVNVPITGMYAMVVAIDWFLDRFRAMVNVCGDAYAARVVASLTGITDPEDLDDHIEEERREPSILNV